MGMSIMEMVATIVAGQSSQRILSAEEIEALIKQTYRALKEIEAIESGGGSSAELDKPSGIQSSAPDVHDYEIRQATSEPKVPPEQSIQDDKIVCIECGEAYKFLTHTHLKSHGLSSDEYRQKWGIPAKQPLAGRSVSQRRKDQAKDRNVGEQLRLAREAARRADQSASSLSSESKGVSSQEKESE